MPPNLECFLALHQVARKHLPRVELAEAYRVAPHKDTRTQYPGEPVRWLAGSPTQCMSRVSTVCQHFICSFGGSGAILSHAQEPGPLLAILDQLDWWFRGFPLGSCNVGDTRPPKGCTWGSSSTRGPCASWDPIRMGYMPGRLLTLCSFSSSFTCSFYPHFTNALWKGKA